MCLCDYVHSACSFELRTLLSSSSLPPACSCSLSLALVFEKVNGGGGEQLAGRVGAYSEDGLGKQIGRSLHCWCAAEVYAKPNLLSISLHCSRSEVYTACLAGDHIIIAFSLAGIRRVCVLVIT